MEIVKIKNSDGYLMHYQGSTALMDHLGLFFGSSLYGMVDYVKDLLSGQDGVFNSNLIYLSREGDFVTIEINVSDPNNDDPEQESIPYEKFVNLLDKWKVICSLTKEPKEIIVLMDGNYNFDICYGFGKELEKIEVA